jgi:ABC-type Fe3+/spermidine/putrescine transport system ATPase subunit
MAQVGTPRELYERPTSRFAATFLGDVNLAEGRVLGREGGFVLVATPWSESPLRVGARDGGPAQAEACTVAIRPEAIAIAAERGEALGPNALAGRIVGESYFGGETVFRVELPFGGALRVARPNAHPAEGLAEGAAVRLTLSPELAILLP